ncbi:calcium uniporter protein, mitochondrial isoform X2 [Parasteatoda tepidariorum]|uniref:calcium uniporter protein, mitochondrial isoform X2 n=1 Tax=Parasteatoda tepidariorum TaxID=114398 RepID=UPI001C726C8F|nr:calcium uniporter protein, mitochondrial isoform X2 [Parasteatoda tepidariorum]
MALMPLKRMPEIAWSITNTTFGIWRQNSSFCMYQKWRNKRHFPRSKQSLPSLRFISSSAVTDAVVPNEVTVYYSRGLPVITVPLPSRREKCRFTLKPVTSKVSDFVQDLQKEDKGIDRVIVQSTDGTRIASSTIISSLMNEDFHLIINDIVYLVQPPLLENLPSEETECLSTVRARVAQLYEALNVNEHQLAIENRLLGELEKLKEELTPLEKKRDEFLTKAQKRSTALSWFGLALMGAQFGVLARLTWWEYSWDIMEPVTYFITYGTTIAMYAYFVLTRQEYILPDVCDRQTLFGFHKSAKKGGWDVKRYNALKDQIYHIEDDLRRLRDPLKLQLPIKEPRR